MADRGEAGAGGDGRERQAAAAMTEPAMRRLVEIVGEIGVIDEAAGQNEERQDGA